MIILIPQLIIMEYFFYYSKKCYLCESLVEVAGKICRFNILACAAPGNLTRERNIDDVAAILKRLCNSPVVAYALVTSVRAQWLPV